MYRRYFILGLVLLAIMALGGFLFGWKLRPEASVWVNPKSGIYHCSSSVWYGQTAYGSRMSESEARKAGFRPANGKPCQ